MATKLLDGVTADGNGPISRVSDLTQFQRPIAFGARSTNFGGGTVTIYAGETDAGVDMMPAMTFTGSGVQTMELPSTWFVQARLAGATTPAAVTVVAGGD